MTANHILLQDGWADTERRLIERAGGVFRLTEREALLLAFLAAHPGKTLTRDTLLREVFGYRSGVLSRTLDTTLQRLRRKIEVDPSDPTLVLTARGVGYRFVPPRVAPRLSNLPDFGDPAFGQEPALRDVQARLTAGRLLTLTGSSGIGKTRLAVAAGHQARQRAEPVWFCGVAGLSGRAGLQTCLAGVLGCRIPDITATLQTPTLLILDGLESMSAEGLFWLEGLLQRCPELRVLATSQRRLRLPGEVIIEVTPLPLDAARSLFLARSGGADIRDEVLSRLSGVPLLIELSAAQTAAFGTVDGLQDQIDASVARSWSLLSPWEQAALAVASVFEGGFFADAFAAVAPSGTVPAERILRDLRDASLITTLPISLQTRQEPRFGLLRFIRTFASSQLGADARHQAHARHGAWYGGMDSRGVQEIALEQGNLEAIWTRKGSPDTRAGAGIRLSWLSDRQGDLEQAEARLNAVIDMIPSLSGAVAARGLYHRSLLLAHSGRLDAASQDVARSVAVAEACGDIPGQLNARLERGFIGLIRGPLSAVREEIPRLVSLVDRLDASPAKTLAEINLGAFLHPAGELLASHRRLTRLLRAPEALPSPDLRWWVEGMLGAIAMDTDNLDEARTRLSGADAWYRETGNRRNCAWTAGSLALLALLGGDNRAAALQLDRALALSAQLGEDVGRVWPLRLKATLLRRQGQRKDALAALDEALQRAGAGGATRWGALVDCRRATVLAELGRLEEAEAALRRARPVLGGQPWADGSWLTTAEVHCAAIRGEPLPELPPPLVADVRLHQALLPG